MVSSKRLVVVWGSGRDLEESPGNHSYLRGPRPGPGLTHRETGGCALPRICRLGNGGGERAVSPERM